MTLEESLEMYERLRRLYDLDAHLVHGLQPMSFWASNQAAHGLECEIDYTVPKPSDRMTREDYRRLHTSPVGPVKLTIWISWGGNMHDGTPRAGTTVGVLLQDRRLRWDGRTWHAQVNGDSADRCVPLVDAAQVEAELRDVIGEYVTAFQRRQHVE